ncbi:hypothetical protein Q427_09530 [Halomonas sp. BC04]|nr:hypothetical protein Q427_09530 [Halomonas sp. BC04]
MRATRSEAFETRFYHDPGASQLLATIIAKFVQ